MSDAPVLYDSQDGIAVVTINRPDNRNSMTPEVMGAFRDAVATAAADTSLRVAVITGAGRSFCGGCRLPERIARRGSR